MRLIDADALEKDYRKQFEAVYKHTRDAVLPSDFYIERRAAYDKEIVRLEMEAFCQFLQGRPTIEAEPVRHGKWVYGDDVDIQCSVCGKDAMSDWMKYTQVYSPYCPWCGAKMDLEERK